MVVARRDWDELIPVRFAQIVGNAEAYCFRDVVARMLMFIDAHSPDYDLAIVFDNRPENTGLGEMLYRQFQGLPIRTRLAGITFQSNEKFPPLQAADIWAWEIFRLASDNLSSGSLQMPRPHAHSFFTSGRFEGRYADRASIQKMAEALGLVGQMVGSIQ
jgi:hypothetical protein